MKPKTKSELMAEWDSQPGRLKKELRQLIEKHEDVVMLADANTMQFVSAKVYSYEETFRRMQEGRDIFC